MPVTVVFVPGMLCDERLWAPVQRAVSHHAAVRDVMLDEQTMNALARQVLAAADGPLFLVGHSLGGIAALHAAALDPRRIRGLVLADTTARRPRPEQRALWDRLARESDFPSAALDVLWPSLVAPSRAGDPVVRRTVETMAERTGLERFRRQLAAQHSRTDLRKALPCPVLAICGALDALCPPELHDEIAGLSADGAVRVIDDAGHLAPVEAADHVATQITGWLVDRVAALGAPLEKGKA